ncbi:MAG: hydantoinase/oxoprolinase family protein [Candidatus Heimdallarchaeaceae archaeon]
MATNQSATFMETKNNIAVLDFGLTTHKIIIIDPAHPEEPLSFQKIYLPLRTRKEELEGILKTLLRSYADYHIRKFIITTSSSFYSSAKETVDFVVQAVTKFIQSRNILCYTIDGEFLPIEEATKIPEKIVAAGWKALGKGVWELVKKDALIVDFSTRTTSFIPIKEGKILSNSSSDHERMKHNELLYYGLLETNAAFIKPKFEYKGETFNLPFEPHAVTADVFLITNDLPQTDYIIDTPDKKAKFKEDAINRIQNMLCIVDSCLEEEDLVEIAEQLKSHMLEEINSNIKRKLEEYNLNRVIVTGSGSGVIYQYLKNKMIYGELILATNIIRSAEINSAYCIAYLYAKKMIVDG